MPWSYWKDQLKVKAILRNSGSGGYWLYFYKKTRPTVTFANKAALKGTFCSLHKTRPNETVFDLF